MFLPDFKKILNLSTDFHESRHDQVSRKSVQWEPCWYMWTDRRREMTKQIGDCRGIAKVPNEGIMLIVHNLGFLLLMTVSVKKFCLHANNYKRDSTLMSKRMWRHSPTFSKKPQDKLKRYLDRAFLFRYAAFLSDVHKGRDGAEICCLTWHDITQQNWLGLHRRWVSFVALAKLSDIRI